MLQPFAGQVSLDYFGPSVTLLITMLGLAVAWGKMKESHVVVLKKLDDVQKRMEQGLLLLQQELKELPKLYVRADVDEEHKRLMDERSRVTHDLLDDIKSELKDLRRKRPQDDT